MTSPLDLSVQQLWTPSGFVPTYIRDAQKAVCEYAGDGYTIARHEHTGDWVVMRTLSDGNKFPVLGLGKELPTPERIKQMLYDHDAVRNGAKIVDKIERMRAEGQKENRKAAEEGAGIAAEAFDWALRNDSDFGGHPIPRIFVPKGVT